MCGKGIWGVWSAGALEGFPEKVVYRVRLQTIKERENVSGSIQ